MFTGRVHAEQADGDNWILLRSLTYNCPVSKAVIVVPEGFTTDFTTVPWYARWVVPITGVHTSSAILHDYLLSIGCGRLYCDMMMWWSMKATGVPLWRRVVIYLGVRGYSIVVKGG
jgi:hypothetical protein